MDKLDNSFLTAQSPQLCCVQSRSSVRTQQTRTKFHPISKGKVVGMVGWSAQRPLSEAEGS